MRTTSTLAALTAAAALALTGCESAPGTNTTGDQGSQAEQSAGDQNTGSQDTFTFGDTYDGPLRTTVAEPEPFTTSQYAQPAGGVDAWKVQVTYENTLDQPYNVALLGVDGYADNTKAKDVFDSAQGVGDAMETGNIAPGANATVTYGFTGKAGAAKKVVISSMDGSTQVTFTGGQQ